MKKIMTQEIKTITSLKHYFMFYAIIGIMILITVNTYYDLKSIGRITDNGKLIQMNIDASKESKIILDSLRAEIRVYKKIIYYQESK